VAIVGIFVFHGSFLRLLLVSVMSNMLSQLRAGVAGALGSVFGEHSSSAISL
jgi:hypothetical protein